jgi:alginate O-acetyltransferase complex protein AlgJ
MRTFTRPLTVIVFFVIALVPVALFGHGGPGRLNSYGPLARAPFPSYFAPHTFRRMGDWFEDRIGLRNVFVEIGAQLNLAILRISTNRNVLIGNDGWLFWSDYEKEPAVRMLDVQGALRFQSAEISSINSNLHSIADSFARCGKAALVIVAPNKQSIYGENLLPVSNASSRLDDLLDNLDRSARSIILDAREQLRAAKRTQHLPLYFKTDTHWNELGAFEVYREIVQRLERVGAVYWPELASLRQYDVKVEPFAGGDLSIQMLQAPWLFSDETVHLRPRPPVLPEAQRVYVDQSNFIYQNSRGQGHLHLIGDSFSLLLARFLSHHFKEVDHHLVLGDRFDVSVATASGADVEILEVVERNLSALQWPGTGLHCTRAPPS